MQGQFVTFLNNFRIPAQMLITAPVLRSGDPEIVAIPAFLDRLLLVPRLRPVRRASAPIARALGRPAEVAMVMDGKKDSPRVVTDVSCNAQLGPSGQRLAE